MGIGKKQWTASVASLLLLVLLTLVSGAAAATALNASQAARRTWGAVTTASEQQPVAGPCALQLAVKRKQLSQRARPGGSVKVSFKLLNLAASTLREAAVTVQLPPYLKFKSGSAARQRYGRPVYDPTTSTVTWPRVSVKPRSDVRFVILVKTTKACVPSAPLTIVIGAVAVDQGPPCPVEGTATVVSGCGMGPRIQMEKRN